VRIIAKSSLYCLVILAGCRPESPKEQPAAAPQPAAQDQWKTHEDKFIRFQYPPDYIVASAIDDSKNKTWMVGRPNENTPGIPDIMGALSVDGFYDGKETRPLGDVLTNDHWGSHKPITKVRQFSPKNGECLMLLTEGGSFGGCADSYGKPKDAPSCAETHFNMRCYDGAKNYYRIGSALGRYEKSRPTGSVQDNLKTVERILASLEFK